MHVKHEANAETGLHIFTVQLEKEHKLVIHNLPLHAGTAINNFLSQLVDGVRYSAQLEIQQRLDDVLSKSRAELFNRVTRPSAETCITKVDSSADYGDLIQIIVPENTMYTDTQLGVTLFTKKARSMVLAIGFDGTLRKDSQLYFLDHTKHDYEVI